MEIKEHKYITKIVIIAVIVVIILILAIYIYYTNIQQDTISQAEESSSFVETNNEYKTFNFTIDDIINLCNLDVNDIITNTEAPYCTEHKDTDCIITFKADEYEYLRVVYEEKSRKVISIELSMSSANRFVLATAQGKNLEESFTISYTYMVASFMNIFNTFQEEVGNDFVNKFNNANKENWITLKDTDTKCGVYFMLDSNTGCVQFASAKTGANTIRVIAISENDFNNLSINSLTNTLDETLEKKNSNTSVETDRQTNKDKEISEIYNVKPIDKKQDIVYTLSNKNYPIINLSGSPEVDNINAKIKAEFAEEDDEYNKSEYNYYLNNEILSLVIENTGPAEGWIYTTYNINIKTGKVISNSDLLKSKNIDETTFISNLKECCKNKFLEVHNEYNIHGLEKEPEYMEGYNESISNCNMQQLMFLDKNRYYKCSCQNRLIFNTRGRI